MCMKTIITTKQEENIRQTLPDIHSGLLLHGSSERP